MNLFGNILIYIFRALALFLVFSIAYIFSFSTIEIVRGDYNNEKNRLVKNIATDKVALKIQNFSFFAVANAVEFSPEYLAKVRKEKLERAKKITKTKKRYSKKATVKSNGKFATKKERKKIIEYIKTKNWDWKIAQAVAMAESGFRTDVKGDHSNIRAPKGSWGIFQINVAVHKKNIGNKNVKNYKDNIDIAYKIYKQAGNRWQPWGAYTNGKYKQFLVK